MLKTFVFLATLYTSDGPVIYVLDHDLSGQDCIERMLQGITPADAAALTTGHAQPEGEAHVPPAPFVLDPFRLVLSCEFTW